MPPTAQPMHSPAKAPKFNRMKHFFQSIFKPSSLKSSASTPTMGMHPEDSQDVAGEHGAMPRNCLGSDRGGANSVTRSIATVHSSLGIAADQIVANPGTMQGPARIASITNDGASGPLPAQGAEKLAPRVKQDTVVTSVLVEGTGHRAVNNSVSTPTIPDHSPPQVEEQVTSNSKVKKAAKLAWIGFKDVASNIEEFLDGTPFKVPIVVLNKIIEIAEAVVDNKDSMAESMIPIGKRLEIISRELHSKRPPGNIKPTLEHFAAALNKASEELEKMHESGLLERILKYEKDPQQIQKIFGKIDEATDQFQLELGLANYRETRAVKDDTEVLRLDGLQPCKQVRYRSLDRKPAVKSCLSGTRKEVIQSIMSWCKDTSQNSSAVYWLSGMAGTGKTTIVHTVCEELAKDGSASRLAASFFCWRQIEGGRKLRNVIPTIAHELALLLPGFRRALLDSKPDANPPQLRDHLEMLLIQPWDASFHDRGSIPPLVVVVDALDELEVEEDAPSFLADLTQKIQDHPNHLRGLKFFVTSRRDPSIVEDAKLLPPGAVYRLEEVPSPTVHEDINLYLHSSLPQLDFDQLSCLGTQAAGLFIYAATAVRFILPPIERPSPSVDEQNERLQILLKEWPDETRRGPEGLLVDHLYEEILNRFLSPMAKHDQTIAVYILHTTVLAEEPIRVSDIPQLVHEHKVGELRARNVMLALHSMVDVSSGYVYFHHKSFTDFLLDPSRFKDQRLAVLCCPTAAVQAQLAASCFHLMDSLQFNMCNLPSSFLHDSDIEDLLNQVDKSISSALKYSCCHWAAHLAKTQPCEDHLIVQLQQWLEQKLLFWMEAMNLLKEIGRCYYALATVRQWLGTTHNIIYQHLLAAENLGAVFRGSIMSQSTPHLYISALASSRDSNLPAAWYDRFRGIPTLMARMAGDAVRQLSLLLHNDYVRSVVFSPDGLKIMSGAGDKLHIWDVSTGQQTLQLDGHEDSVNSADFSVDGSRAISGSNDKTVCIWDTTTGKQLFRLDGHEKAVTSVAFSLDGSHAISGSEDNSVRIWELPTGKQLCQLDGHKSEVRSVNFSPDGSRAISGSDDKTIRIWDTLAGKEVVQLNGHTGQVMSVAYSSDGFHTISGSGDHTIRIWDTSTGKEVIQLDGHTDWVRSVAFSPDGSRAISGSDDNTIRIWDTSTGKELVQLPGHTDWVMSVAFTPDGFRAISGSDDKTVRIWDVSSGKLSLRSHEPQNNVKSGADSYDGSCTLSGSADENIHIWDMWQQAGHEDAVNSVAFSPDGSRAISGSDDKTVHIWDTTTGTQLFRLDGHEESIASVGFSLDGRRAISGSGDKTVRIWDATTGKQLLQLDGHTKCVRSVNFSPDGSRAISGSDDNTIRIWDTSTGKELVQLAGHTDCVNSVAFSPDGFRAISGSDDHTIRIWDTSTGKELFQLDSHNNWVWSVDFSPDGFRAISGSRDNTIRIWDTSTGQELVQLAGHKGSVWSVDFSPDGSHVISGSMDQTIRIWDVSTGQQLLQLDGHESYVYSVAFSPDGTRVISGSRDKDVRIWTLDQLDTTQALWSLNPDGWITSSAGNKLFWLPSNMFRFLSTPQCLIMSSRGSVNIDFSKACLGTEWAKCYKKSH
ncbi:WD40-repeat-containing domain protein [Mycena galopus ATCC 62051]|nr:WD40-repeat-containing domain protein [Mycena galopus ATCC 62051]